MPFLISKNATLPSAAIGHSAAGRPPNFTPHLASSLRRGNGSSLLRLELGGPGSRDLAVGLSAFPISTGLSFEGGTSVGHMVRRKANAPVAVSLAGLKPRKAKLGRRVAEVAVRLIAEAELVPHLQRFQCPIDLVAGLRRQFVDAMSTVASSNLYPCRG